MTGFFKRSVLASALVLASVASAQAATTTLTFSQLIDFSSSLSYDNTVGGDLTVTADGGKLVIIGGELGVAKLKLFDLDPRLGKNESITFSFQDAVSLSFWDMDDLNLDGSNKFGLSVDGSAIQQFSLDSKNPGALTLTGNTFTFSYAKDSYFIDTLKFSSVTPAVPEPTTAALVLAGLSVAGVIARRRKTF